MKKICFVSMFPYLLTSANIAPETLCFLSMFARLFISENIVLETLRFLSTFPCLLSLETLLQKHYVSYQCFLVCSSLQTLLQKHYVFYKCFPVCPPRKHCCTEHVKRLTGNNVFWVCLEFTPGLPCEHETIISKPTHSFPPPFVELRAQRLSRAVFVYQPLAVTRCR